jgi:hypothetical protein
MFQVRTKMREPDMIALKQQDNKPPRQPGQHLARTLTFFDTGATHNKRGEAQ